MESITRQLLQLLGASPLTGEQITAKLEAPPDDVARAIGEALREKWIDNLVMAPADALSPHAPSPPGGHWRLTTDGRAKLSA